MRACTHVDRQGIIPDHPAQLITFLRPHISSPQPPTRATLHHPRHLLELLMSMQVWWQKCAFVRAMVWFVRIVSTVFEWFGCVWLSYFWCVFERASQ